MSFWRSELVKGLEKGEFPSVAIEIETDQLVRIGLMLFVVILLGVLSNGIIKVLTK